MSKEKTSKALMGAGILSAIAASLCCITPLLALLAGSSGLASSFSWLEPARPYLIGITVLVLGFAWYLKLKPKPADECGCAEDEKPKFFQSRTFLAIVTIFSVLMLAFPYYSNIFYPHNRKEVIVVDKSDVQHAEFKITGMTCKACEEEIKHEVNKLEGIVKVEVSYDKSKAEVEYDKTKTNVDEITKAINSTGYKATQSDNNN